jgi:hypothetical protein
MMKPAPVRRRRYWLLILFTIPLGIAGLWTALWFFAAGITEQTIAGWKAREAQAGRLYSCATQSVGGFPFGIEVRCAGMAAELVSSRPPLVVKSGDLLVSAMPFSPTALTSELIGPFTIAERTEPAVISANWRRAQTKVKGLPASPEAVSFVLEEPQVDRLPSGDNLFQAARLEVSGRLISGTVRRDPVIEIVVKLAAATAPSWHPAAAAPVDADATAILRGLKDLAPKPWPVRFRALQESGGRIEVTKARLKQGDMIAVATGVLGLSPAGRLDGQLQLTVANLEAVLPVLGLDRVLTPEASPPRLNRAFGALDRIMPGLGNVARQNVGPAIVAGINIMGQPTELEGQRAVVLPLRFNDGAVSLGPLLLGYTPPLL